jgi:hypothetical protein
MPIEPCRYRSDAYIGPDGYTHIAGTSAHRLAWEEVHGPIPTDREVDHICRNRWCDEITHLRLLTHRENLLASPDTPAGINARKTHCRHDHEYTPANTRMWRNKRICIQCERDRNKRRHPSHRRAPDGTVYGR